MMRTIENRIGSLFNSKLFYLILAITLVIYVGINFLIKRSGSMPADTTKFTGVLKKVQIEEDKVKFNIDVGHENVVCNYYVENATYDEYLLGTEVEIEGKLKAPKNNTVPNTFNYKEYLYYHDTYYTCTVDEIKVLDDNIGIFYEIKNAIVKRIMSFDTKDYLYTLIIGDKTLLDDEVYEQYRENGVTHLFAISGMHIGLFSGIILCILKKCGFKDKASYIVTMTFIWLYAFLVGFSPSVLRACLLFTLLGVFKALDIKINTIKVLFLTAAILLFYNYAFIVDVGFQYSFLITFGLMYSKEFLERHKVIGTSLVATLYSIPLTIRNFYNVNFLAIVNNLVFVPLVSMVVYPLTLLTMINRLLEPILKVSIWILEFINTVLSKVEMFTFVVPKVSILFLIMYYVILILYFKKKPVLVSILLIGLVFLVKIKPLLDDSSKVVFLDVGQGDSTLYVSPRSRDVILIDTGGVVSFNGEKKYFVSKNTITFLNSLGIDRIDTMVLTHGDADHMGDAEYVVDNIKVDNVIFNKGEKNSLEKDLIRVLNKKNIEYSFGLDYLDLKSNKINLLNTRLYDNENDNSNVLYFKIGGYSLLLMGDAGIDKESDILDKYNIEKVDFLKVGHHGSDTSSGKSFIDVVKPRYSIISVGEHNRYGHPKNSVLETLSNSRIYRTDMDGSVQVKLKNGKYMIKTYSP